MYEEEWFDLSERQAAKKQVPVERIMERLVKLENKDDCESAITHLEYWVKEARGCGDLRAEFTLTNELTGLYRKTGREKEAVAAINRERVEAILNAGDEDSTESYTSVK